jgi:hypothetical protein
MQLINDAALVRSATQYSKRRRPVDWKTDTIVLQQHPHGKIRESCQPS